MTPARFGIVFAIVAAIAGAGELIFLAANVRAFHSAPRAVWWTSDYFTDWTGALVTIVCTAAALRWRILASPFWLGLATVAVVLVGTMVAWLGGWTQLSEQGVGSAYHVSNLLAHIIAPWAMLLAWLFAVEHGGLKWRDAALFMLFPLVYLAQMFARGALGHGYPYPQVDVGRVGWGSALTFAGTAALLFLALGLVLVGIDRLLTKRRVEPTMSRVVDPRRADGDGADG